MLILNICVQIFTIISVLVATLAILLSTQASRRQMNVQVFTTYCDRYEKIMSEFPENAFHSRFDLTSVELPERSTTLTLCILKYLNLSSEEFYLWKSKYVDDKVWKIWEDEIKRMVKSPLLQREWSFIHKEFDGYPDFKRFVETQQAINHSTILP